MTSIAKYAAVMCAMYRIASRRLHRILWRLSFGRSFLAFNNLRRTTSQAFTSSSYDEEAPEEAERVLLSTHGWKSSMTQDPLIDVWKPLNMTDPWPVQNSEPRTSRKTWFDDPEVLLTDAYPDTKPEAAELSVVMVVASEHEVPEQTTSSTKNRGPVLTLSRYATLLSSDAKYSFWPLFRHTNTKLFAVTC
jgi:hypothetical protein